MSSNTLKPYIVQTFTLIWITVVSTNTIMSTSSGYCTNISYLDILRNGNNNFVYDSCLTMHSQGY